MINLNELEKLCQSATPGEWIADDNIVFCDGESVALDCRRQDASFIASANPDTVLALVRIARAAKDHRRVYAVEEACALPEINRREKELDEALRGVE